MKFDKAFLINMGVITVCSVLGVLIANNLVQPHINSMRVAPPATA